MTETPPPPTVAPVDKVHDHALEREMHTSYIDYAMSVIVGRALPDGRDGMKPVQRRILWSMWESGATHDHPYRKSARTVGDVLGKYHPHGDMAVYDALVRMAQPFSLRYPLIDSQGNFGSIDGDSPAAMRYTEARLSLLAEEILADIEKETVDWTDNFDGSLKQPLVLPSKVPNLLVNGSAGIAVGMATNMPPHNLGEVVDGLLLLLARPGASAEELLGVIPGPDFPTGGYLSAEGVREAYLTGRGTLHLRGAAEIRERDGRDEIVITETPYEVNKAQLLELIADLVKTKRIDGITDLRDESDRHGTSVVLELRRDAAAEIVLNHLYEHTPLETSFGVINLCILEGRPRVLSLKELLETHLQHRRSTLTRRTAFDLRKTAERLHLLEGFLTAIDHIDEVIKIIRRSKDAAAAETSLMGKFLLSTEQAKAILDMRLVRLTALEREAVETERAEKEALARQLKEVLADPKRLDALIVAELNDLKARFGDARRTRIVPGFTARTLADLVPEMDVVVLVTRAGYVKRLPLDQYPSATTRRPGPGPDRDEGGGFRDPLLRHPDPRRRPVLHEPGPRLPAQGLRAPRGEPSVEGEGADQPPPEVEGGRAGPDAATGARPGVGRRPLLRHPTRGGEADAALAVPEHPHQRDPGDPRGGGGRARRRRHGERRRDRDPPRDRLGSTRSLLAQRGPPDRTRDLRRHRGPPLRGEGRPRRRDEPGEREVPEPPLADVHRVRQTVPRRGLPEDRARGARRPDDQDRRPQRLGRGRPPHHRLLRAPRHHQGRCDDPDVGERDPDAVAQHPGGPRHPPRRE